MILKFKFEYIDTKHQPADILTKGNFTREEWNSLLFLFNISHFSSTSCAENSSLISCPKTMAKRMQEQKEEERIVAKSKPTVMNMSLTVLASSSSAERSDCNKKPGFDLQWNYDRSPTDNLVFMNTTLQAAVHLGQDFLENLRFTKNQFLKSMQ